MGLGKRELREAIQIAAGAGSWDSASDLYKSVLTQPQCKALSFWDFLRTYRKDETGLAKIRDDAAVARNVAVRGHVAAELDCPRRHGAAPFVTWDEGFSCSLCSEVIVQSAACLGCRLCDYDACPDCVQRARVASGKVAVEPTTLGSAATELNGGSTSQESPGTVGVAEFDCPGKHGVVEFLTWDEGFCCTLCAKDVHRGGSCLGCRICDYDVCQECVQRARGSTAAGGEKAKPGSRRRKAAGNRPG